MLTSGAALAAPPDAPPGSHLTYAELPWLIQALPTDTELPRAATDAGDLPWPGIEVCFVPEHRCSVRIVVDAVGRAAAHLVANATDARPASAVGAPALLEDQALSPQRTYCVVGQSERSLLTTVAIEAMNGDCGQLQHVHSPHGPELTGPVGQAAAAPGI
jgi:hypothetical protein